MDDDPLAQQLGVVRWLVVALGVTGVTLALLAWWLPPSLPRLEDATRKLSEGTMSREAALEVIAEVSDFPLTPRTASTRSQWGAFIQHAHGCGVLSMDDVVEWLRRSAMAVVVASPETISLHLSRQDGSLPGFRYLIQIDSIEIDETRIRFADDTGWHMSWAGTLAGVTESTVIQLSRPADAQVMVINWRWELLSSERVVSKWDVATRLGIKPGESAIVHPQLK
ncbi:MAG: hypothetical protein ACF8NJ_03565 [Phycisphaerales bacterium JB038]